MVPIVSDKRQGQQHHLEAITKEVEEKLNESFTSSSEDLMSLINSGLRKASNGNNEDEEKEGELTIIRQNTNERAH